MFSKTSLFLTKNTPNFFPNVLTVTNAKIDVWKQLSFLNEKTIEKAFQMFLIFLIILKINKTAYDFV